VQLDALWVSGLSCRTPYTHSPVSKVFPLPQLRPSPQEETSQLLPSVSLLEFWCSMVSHPDENPSCTIVWLTFLTVLSIFMVGMLVPSNDANLLRSTGTAAQSPFVIAATNAGIKIVPSIINAIVLTSAWSAGNSYVLNASRTMFGMSCDGHAPKIFQRVNRFGIPYVAVLFFCCFICLAFMTVSSSASVIFNWLQDLVSVATLVNWLTISVVYLRFYYGMKKQGIDRSELPWAAPFQPYAAWISLCAFSILLLTGGYAVFIHGE
jgi:amino acid transporter